MNLGKYGAQLQALVNLPVISRNFLHKKFELRMESSCVGGKQLFLDREANAQHSGGWRRIYKSFSLSVANLYDQPLQENGKKHYNHLK